ncbi:Protein pih1d3 [Lobulomyces angularis]|nr:Protein pih1d3 [Lobulomyces angularis]
MNSDFSSLTELFSTNEKQLKKEKEQIQKEEYLKKNIKQKSTTQNKKDIWEDEEIVAAEEAEELNDPRSQPEYDIAYRQTVSSEDMFLGMSGKLNSISHSDFLVVTIKLPGVKFKEVQLDCTEFKIDLRCPI